MPMPRSIPANTVLLVDNKQAMELEATMNKNQDVDALLDKILKEYKDHPVDLLGGGDGEGEYRYLVNHRSQYARAVQDLLEYAAAGERSSIRILEIGPFLGLVSVLLAKLGFQVAVFDIEEYLKCPRLREKLKQANVEWASGNLRDYALPFCNGEFDVVLMCETLEHLNFNPLPVIDEMKRVLKPGGYLYLTVPNLARCGNRINLLRGQSIHNPIRDFFAQLDAKANMMVGLHWREYTGAEVREMLERMGFAIQAQKFDLPAHSSARLKRLVKKTVHRFINLPGIRSLIYGSLVDPDDPTLNPTYVAIARKQGRSGT